MSQHQDSSNLSRAEFLRLAAIGAGGFGLAGIAGCESHPRGVAERGRRGYVVAVTHGPDDPNRVLLALTAATRLPEGDNHVWFAIDGGQIAKKDVAQDVSSEMFPQQETAAAVLEELRSQGVAFHI
ncbi:MAG: hypothetical protein KY476_21285 [Planctomycetes bacterium]|nr:hypothetical protein [Planctomycetota bacterium]